MKKFLVVVDTQYDFVMPDGALYVAGAEDIIVPGVKFLANLDPDEYSGVLFTYDTHDRETYFFLPESNQFPIHCVEDEFGWQNVFNHNMIDRRIPFHTLKKGVFSMWEEVGSSVMRYDRRTWAVRPDVDFLDRDEMFKQLKKTVDTIEVMGVASDYCVKWAVDGFVQRGFKVDVLQKLVREIETSARDVFDGAPYRQLVNLV